jgi:hypothetical protein
MAVEGETAYCASKYVTQKELEAGGCTAARLRTLTTV